MYLNVSRMCLNVLQVVLRSKTYNGSGKDSSGHDDSEESIQSLISNLTKNLEVRKQHVVLVISNLTKNLEVRKQHVVLGLPQQTRFHDQKPGGKKAT